MKNFFRTPFSDKPWIQKIIILMISAIIMFIVVMGIMYKVSAWLNISDKSEFVIDACTASFTALSAFFVGVQEHEDYRHDIASENETKKLMALKAVNVFNDKIARRIMDTVNKIDNYLNQNPIPIAESRGQAREICLTDMIVHHKISIGYLSNIIFSISKWSMGYLDESAVDINLIDKKLRKIIMDFARPGSIVVYYIQSTSSESDYELSGYNRLVNRYMD